MSQEPSAKRQRVDDGSVPAYTDPISYQQRISELDLKIKFVDPLVLQIIAARVTREDPWGLAASAIDEEYQRYEEAERARAARAISFAKYVYKADYILNKKYSHLSDSEEYDASGEAQATLEAMLNTIVKRTTGSSAYATKKSAVETMRSIFEIMLATGGVMGKEMRKYCYDWDSKFLHVMGEFTLEELQRLANEEGGAWVDQFRVLVSKAKSYGILERLQESLSDLENLDDPDAPFQVDQDVDEDESKDEQESEDKEDEDED